MLGEGGRQLRRAEAKAQRRRRGQELPLSQIVHAGPPRMPASTGHGGDYPLVARAQARPVLHGNIERAW